MKQQALIETEAAIVPQPTSTPMALLSIAMGQNADIDKLTKLWELQQQWEDSEARKDFDIAFAAFKANPPQITKNKHVKFQTAKGITEYDHATLDNVVDSITAALSVHGITHRWSVEQSSRIRVTCTLNKGRHSESASLEAGPDDGGGKNSLQAIASTVSYLERYTLLAVTGMATSDMDNDGQTAGAMTDLQEKLEWIKNCRNHDELKKVYFEAIDLAKKAKDKAAQDALIAAKDARYKEIANAAH